jgi:hypothetical protein
MAYPKNVLDNPLTVGAVKGPVFWGIKLCSPVKVNRRLFAVCFLLGSIFYPENGGDMSLRNLGGFSLGSTT